jgi:excisionase family DNA binding protein
MAKSSVPIADRAAYSIAETAQILGCWDGMVRGYVRDNRLRTVRLGRRILIRREELDRFLKERESKA